jgi:hypothetical protein
MNRLILGKLFDSLLVYGQALELSVLGVGFDPHRPYQPSS